jgi:hypothetical protein
VSEKTGTFHKRERARQRGRRRKARLTEAGRLLGRGGRAEKAALLRLLLGWLAEGSRGGAEA